MARMDPFREAGVDFVTVTISRETVEAGDLAPALDSLSALVESRESARHFAAKNHLFELYRLEEDRNEEISGAINDYYGLE